MPSTLKFVTHAYLTFNDAWHEVLSTYLLTYLNISFKIRANKRKQFP